MSSLVESSTAPTIPTDITDNAQVQAAISEILKTESRIDVLINNAGMGMVGAVEDSTKEDILKLFNLNLVGAVQMMSAVMPKMREQKFGKMWKVNILLRFQPILLITHKFKQPFQKF